ncbi:MAG: NADH-quinone oxidoreductase subunit NuoG, partial [Alphaproteobacteria bacterium]
PLPPAPEGMLNVFVDGTLLHVKKGSTVMQACTKAEKEIPHFCFHERLSVAGNCRMCMVEIEGMPKPLASCHWPAAEGMKIRTNSPVAEAARKGTMELLLINHPLDCPICDQGGECQLQDLSVAYGGDRTHYVEPKRAVDDLEIGSKIKTVMTRCIHCTRCIRFATEIAGVEEMGATGRGETMQVGTYVAQALQSELAGNMIDLCPVGALTNKQYAFQGRPWELVGTDTIDVLDAVGSAMRLDARAGKILRAVARENAAVNEEWISDAARYSVDAHHTNRLATPHVKKGREMQPANWPEAFEAVKSALKGIRKNRIAGLMDNLHSAEDAFAFRAFMTDVLGTDNVDSRTVNSAADSKHHALNICHTPFEQWDKADAILLVGINPRTEAPVLNVKLRRAATKGRAPVYAVGVGGTGGLPPVAAGVIASAARQSPNVDLTYPHHNLGDKPEILSNLPDAFLKAQRPLVVISGRIHEREDALALLATLHKATQRDGWNGFNVLHDTCGRITALDMAVHPVKGGMATADILKAARAGTLDVLVLYGDCDLTPADLKGFQGTLIYVGTHATEIAKVTDILLPASTFAEKEGLFANAEGRVQEAKAATKPPLNAKEDWKIFRALSEELGHKLPFDTLAKLRTLVADFCPAYAPENRNKILPTPFKPAAKIGKLSATPLPVIQSSSYQLTSFHRQSPYMHKLAAEHGTAHAKKEAA